MSIFHCLQIDGQSLTPEELVAIGYGSCPGLQEGSITQSDALATSKHARVEFDSEYVVEVTRYDEDEEGSEIHVQHYQTPHSDIGAIRNMYLLATVTLV